MPTRFLTGLLVATFTIGHIADAQTGRRARRSKTATTNTTAATPAAAPAPANISLAEPPPPNVDVKPESVVMLPDGPRQQVDTALINPEPTPRRRRFAVKVVPAAPPGRSRQEIMYTDSIANRSPRR